MKKILIFKSDKLGDLINISSIFFNLKKKYPDCNITLVCSKYNYPIANIYSNDISIIFNEKNFLYFILKNFNLLFLKKFDAIIQLDGKNSSYLSSIFIRSKIKACIQFIKSKKVFGLKFSISRPNFFLKFFFNILERSIENYEIHNNKDFHYLNLYLNLLSKMNIPIYSKKHYLPYNLIDNITTFNNFDYFLFHLDERWLQFDSSVFDNLKDKILQLSINNKIIVTSNLGENSFFNQICKVLKNKQNIEIFKSPTINETLNLIYFSHTCVSSHSGLIVHVAAAFNKNIIDLVPEKIFNELDRWIPHETNYKRINIYRFIDKNFFFKI